MSLRERISNGPSRSGESLQEKLYREERAYRADRLAEKWSRIPEIGKGIDKMPANTARNLAILLENQSRAMSKLSEAQLSSAFNG